MSNQAGRACQAQRESGVEGATLELTLQAIGPALVLLDRMGRAAFVSRKARALLESGDSLHLMGRYLSAKDPADCAALTALLAATLDPHRSRRLPLVRPVLIPRQTGGLYRVSALPISSPVCRPVGGRSVGVMIFIRTVQPNTEAVTRVLHLLYGLTPAEIRLALLLNEGRSLADCAHDNGVSIETVRAQLKSIFHKAGLHRQSQLLELLNELGEPG